MLRVGEEVGAQRGAASYRHSVPSPSPTGCLQRLRGPFLCPVRGSVGGAQGANFMLTSCSRQHHHFPGDARTPWVWLASHWALAAWLQTPIPLWGARLSDRS